MDLIAYGDGRWAIGLMRTFEYEVQKDRSIKVWSKSKEPDYIHMQTDRGIFIEAVDDDGRTRDVGGDSEWPTIPVGKKPLVLRVKKLPKPSLSKAEKDEARQSVTRYLVSDSPSGAGIEGKLIDSIKWMQKQLQKVPKACRASTSIEFRNRHEYGESYEHVEITYSEPETDDELTFRLQVEAERKRLSLARKRTELAKLKAELE